MRLRQDISLTREPLPIPLMPQRARWSARRALKFTTGGIVLGLSLEELVQLRDLLLQGPLWIGQQRHRVVEQTHVAHRTVDLRVGLAAALPAARRQGGLRALRERALERR